ncbi:MAG: sugar phosphate isomerase/epimerase [Planctomycetota bacterium]|nr:MAG: sugar phosphate isomerase/epimerase [Planctomycetota bacterium]
MPVMLRLAYSTLACPEWTLPAVARATIDSAFEGVELRTFGPGSSRLACDPALTAPVKIVEELFADDGVEIAGLAASSRFDEPVRPPVIGWAIGDTERDVRDAKRHIDLAEAVGASYVRVFAFEPAPAERPSAALRRIARRLALVCDHARQTGVRVALENGGGYPRARHLAEIIDRVSSPYLDASYSIAVGAMAGDDADEAASLLGDRLLVGRIKDLRNGRPCLPGDGEIPCRAFLESLGDAAAWAVFEWDRMWLPDLAPAEEVLPAAVARLTEWAYAGSA